MKRNVLLIVGAIAAVPLCFLGTKHFGGSAVASEPAPPSKMDPLDAAHAKIEVLEVNRLLAEIDPHIKRLLDFEDRYHVVLIPLGKPPGTRPTAINFDTGEITRAPTPQVSAAAPPQKPVGTK